MAEEASDATKRGIIKYMRTVSGWMVIRVPMAAFQRWNASALGHWIGGAIAAITDQASVKSLKSYRFPIVNVIESSLARDFDTVSVDNAQCAAMALEHLASLGISRFVYLPWAAAPDNSFRQTGFIAAAEAAGLGGRVTVLDDPSLQQDWLAFTLRHAKVIAGLPKPVGVFCFADWLAAVLLEGLKSHRISVPEEVALLGVDDEEMICEGCRPTLSSVDQGLERVGFEAAMRVVELAGGRGPRATVRIKLPPVGVIERASTQMLAVEDEDVSAALRLIQRDLSEGKRRTVEDVAARVLISRRSLDAKFMVSIGRTAADEIDRLRVNAVKRMLSRTSLPVSEIASRTGFATVAHLSRIVRRATGMPPMAYRRHVQVLADVPTKLAPKTSKLTPGTPKLMPATPKLSPATPKRTPETTGEKRRPKR